MTWGSVARRAAAAASRTRRSSGRALLSVVLLTLALGVCSPSPAAEAYTSPASSYGALAGSDRYQTAILVSQRAYPSPAGAPAVVLVKGDNFPDALAAAPVAAAFGGPVLLTPSSGLTDAVRAELTRLDPQTVFFVGLPDFVRPQVAGAVPDADVIPVVGRDRYETAALLADKLKEKIGSVSKIVLAPGDSFPDALAAAPLAANKRWPVLLTPQSGPLPAITSAKVKALGVTSALVVGTQVKLPSSVTQVVSKVGSDRYETSTLVAAYGKSVGLSYSHLGLVKGDDYPDGLVAGAYLGLDKGLLLLVGPSGLHPVVKNALAAERTSISDMDLVGLGARAQVVLEQLGAGVTVTDVRTAEYSGRTRVVVEFSGQPGPVNMRVTPTGSLLVDVPAALVMGAEPPASLATPEVAQMSVGTAGLMPALARVDLRLGRFGRYEVTKLAPSGESGYRVVIDVYNRTDGPPGLGGPLVVLDAGHGGYDPGAVGVTGLYEKNVNLGLVLRTDAHLREAGMRTLLTRSSDAYVALSARTATANDAQASIFVCVHNNAATSSAANGTETYYWGADGAYSVQGRLLASAIQKSLVAELRSNDRGIDDHSGLYVLNNSDMTAVLAEIGFLTNPVEEAKLKDPVYVDRAAQAISKGILEYLGWPSTVD